MRRGEQKVDSDGAWEGTVGERMSVTSEIFDLVGLMDLNWRARRFRRSCTDSRGADLGQQVVRGHAKVNCTLTWTIWRFGSLSSDC